MRIEFPPGRPAFLKAKGRPRKGEVAQSRAFSRHCYRLAYEENMTVSEIAAHHGMAYAPIWRRITEVEHEILDGKWNL